MSPFEALYGRQCRSPIGWFDSVEMDFLDTDFLRDAMEQVWCDEDWKEGKLRSRCIGPFEILSRVGEVAYKLAFPPSLLGVHPVFHVSMLWKYIPDESHVLSLDSVELDLDLTYEEEHIAILDRHARKLRTKELVLVKVQWKHRSVREATWETESDMHSRYPQLFEALGTFFYFMFEDEHDF
ncbi:uncharacterized protein [Solanum lycopersicum]|uniref:uncharacterized protein n=1 Tax=Solanum lycopersicum TaxID=4081 RepID=UPI00374A036F